MLIRLLEVDVYDEGEIHTGEFQAGAGATAGPSARKEPVTPDPKLALPTGGSTISHVQGSCEVKGNVPGNVPGNGCK